MILVPCKEVYQCTEYSLWMWMTLSYPLWIGRQLVCDHSCSPGWPASSRTKCGGFTYNTEFRSSLWTCNNISLDNFQGKKCIRTSNIAITYFIFTRRGQNIWGLRSWFARLPAVPEAAPGNLLHAVFPCTTLINQFITWMATCLSLQCVCVCACVCTGVWLSVCLSVCYCVFVFVVHLLVKCTIKDWLSNTIYVFVSTILVSVKSSYRT